MKIVSLLFFVIVSILSQTGAALAYEVPNFTSCVNPSGEIKANYETGTHGIAGNNSSFEGKDTVYTLSGDALTQCFCSINGAGIQTNWWKVSSLTEQEVEILKISGWNYIPNGGLWGLESEPYLAFNSDYSCKGSTGGDGNSSTSSGGSGSSNNSGSGSVLAAAAGGVGQVLGLASTGNIKFVISFLSFSILALLLGLILKIRSRKSS